MSETKKNIAIGVVVIVGILLVLRVLLFLHPSFGDSGFVFHAKFYDIEKIGNGTRATYAGKPVGEVKKIAILERSDAEIGLVYSYDLTIAIDSKIKLYTTDEITLSTSGLMGERYIAIIPKALTKDSKALDQGGTLYAQKSASIRDITQNAAGVSKNLESITEIVNKPEALSQMMQNSEKATENFAYVSDELKKSMPELEHAIHNISTLVTKISEGQGSLGQLLENDTLYFKAYAIMDKADTLMDDITQYGLLFHLSKGWQRAQKAKQNEFAKYHDPAQFQAFLLTEMQKISDSLTKLQAAIQGSENSKDQKEMERAMKALSRDLERLQQQINPVSLEQ